MVEHNTRPVILQVYEQHQAPLSNHQNAAPQSRTLATSAIKISVKSQQEEVAPKFPRSGSLHPKIIQVDLKQHLTRNNMVVTSYEAVEGSPKSPHAQAVSGTATNNLTPSPFSATLKRRSATPHGAKKSANQVVTPEPHQELVM